MHQQFRKDGPGDLKRVISLKLLVLYGLGTMIGAGIYVLIGADCTRLRENFCLSLPDWQIGLRQCVERLCSEKIEN